MEISWDVLEIKYPDRRGPGFAPDNVNNGTRFDWLNAPRRRPSLWRPFPKQRLPNYTFGDTGDSAGSSTVVRMSPNMWQRCATILFTGSSEAVPTPMYKLGNVLAYGSSHCDSTIDSGAVHRLEVLSFPRLGLFGRYQRPKQGGRISLSVLLWLSTLHRTLRSRDLPDALALSRSITHRLGSIVKLVFLVLDLANLHLPTLVFRSCWMHCLNAGPSVSFRQVRRSPLEQAFPPLADGVGSTLASIDMRLVRFMPSDQLKSYHQVFSGCRLNHDFSCFLSDDTPRGSRSASWQSILAVAFREID